MIKDDHLNFSDEFLFDDGRLTKRQIIRPIRPYFNLIYNCCEEGINTWKKLALKKEKITAEFQPRTIASIVNDIVVKLFKEHLCCYDNIELISLTQTSFGFVIDEKFVLRIKKLDNRYYPGNINTQTIKKIKEQTLFDDGKIIVTVGYRVDAEWQKIKDVSIVYFEGEILEWHHTIPKQAEDIEYDSSQPETSRKAIVRSKTKIIKRQNA